MMSTTAAAGADLDRGLSRDLPWEESEEAIHKLTFGPNTLSALQGYCMHKLLVLSHSNPTTTDPKFQKYTRIHGLMLSFCSSFVLNELPYNALKESWKTIGEHAVSVVTAIHDCGILNADVKRNSSRAPDTSPS
jgi:hypothetical protein